MTGPAVGFPMSMPQPSTPDELLTLYFGVLQGDAGASRDWDSFVDLFMGGAHLRVVVVAEGKEQMGEWGIREFVDHARELYEPNGISQIETGRVLEIQGSTAHGWCRFESRAGTDSAPAIASGIQSLQMIRLGGRWWITSVAVHLN